VSRRRLLLGPAAHTASSGVRISYVVRVLLEQFDTDGASVFGVVDAILREAAQSSSLAADTKMQVEAIKGAPVAALAISDVDNDNSDVVLTVRKTAAPTSAPTNDPSDDEKYNATLTIVLLIIMLPIALVLLGLLIHCCFCSNKSKSQTSRRIHPKSSRFQEFGVILGNV